MRVQFKKLIKDVKIILGGNIMKIKNGNLEYIADANITELVPLDNSIYRNKVVLKLEKILKRGIDIIGSLFGILALIPLTIFVYIANLIAGDKGPVFYSQERIGKNGKLFKMYKYRSMVVDADERLEKYLAENEEARKEYAEYKKLKYDPRVTKMGNFIRKTSIDEFPQFINVLKGEMSLVGPRPYLPKEKEEMNGFYKFITSCKPGITGLWQISGRSECTFNERLDLDMKYFNNHRLKSDLKILKETAKKIVIREGAI